MAAGSELQLIGACAGGQLERPRTWSAKMQTSRAALQDSIVAPEGGVAEERRHVTVRDDRCAEGGL